MTRAAPSVVLFTTSYPNHEEDLAGHFVAAEVEKLQRTGADVSVVSPGSRFRGPAARRISPLHAGLCGPGGIMPRLRAHPWRVVGLVPLLAQAALVLRRTRPDELVLHWLLPGAPLLFIPGKWRRKVVVHGSDLRLLQRAPAGARRAFLERCIATGTTWQFVSRELRDLALSWAPALRQADLHVEPAALALPELPPRATLRAQRGFADGEHWTIIVARLIPEKRVDVALEALALEPRGRVLVVGDGPLRAELQQRFPAVRFVGQLPRREALACMSASDLLVQASRYEGAPTVLREARALHLPVVTVRCGDVDEWAEADPQITVSAGYDALSIAEAIERSCRGASDCRAAE